MQKEYEIQDPKNYLDYEKDLCKFLSAICNTEVFLGYGPESWFDGKRIIINRNDSSPALTSASVGRFDVSFSILLEQIGHVLAHIRCGNNEHNIDFYKTQVSVVISLTNNFVRMTKVSTMGRKPNFVKANSKIVEYVEKRIMTTNKDLMAKISASVVGIVETVKQTSETELLIVARKLTWTNYLKLIDVLNHWKSNFPSEVNVYRQTRHPKR